jgi:hypothetical protein
MFFIYYSTNYTIFGTGDDAVAGSALALALDAAR